MTRDEAEKLSEEALEAIDNTQSELQAVSEDDDSAEIMARIEDARAYNDQARDLVETLADELESAVRDAKTAPVAMSHAEDLEAALARLVRACRYDAGDQRAALHEAERLLDRQPREYCEARGPLFISHTCQH